MSLHTYFSDEITLIWLEKTQDNDGFETGVEHKRCFCCDFEEGVSQSEFYRSMKAGNEASAQAEIQTADYEDFWPDTYAGLRFAEFRGKRYRILRSFPQTLDTTTVILTEVIR